MGTGIGLSYNLSLLIHEESLRKGLNPAESAVKIALIRNQEGILCLASFPNQLRLLQSLLIFSGLVHRVRYHPNDIDTLILHFLLNFRKVRNFLHAGTAPGGKNIHHGKVIVGKILSAELFSVNIHCLKIA